MAPKSCGDNRRASTIWLTNDAALPPATCANNQNSPRAATPAVVAPLSTTRTCGFMSPSGYLGLQRRGLRNRQALWSLYDVHVFIFVKAESVSRATELPGFHVPIENIYLKTR